MIITIDGPASSGKGTIAKMLAKKIGYTYIDTGAMYRALTYFCLKEEIDVFDEVRVSAALSNVKITFDSYGDIFVNDENVTSLIRTDEISRLTSQPVSVYEKVREGIVEQERLFAQGNDVVVDGRDSGTVVFPEANYKFFVSASLEERAQRRYQQNIEFGHKSDYNEILNELAKRDRNDIMRSISPLRIAKDGIVVDTTKMNTEQTLDYIYGIIKSDSDGNLKTP